MFLNLAQALILLVSLAGASFLIMCCILVVADRLEGVRRNHQK